MRLGGTQVYFSRERSLIFHPTQSYVPLGVRQSLHRAHGCKLISAHPRSLPAEFTPYSHLTDKETKAQKE